MRKEEPNSKQAQQVWIWLLLPILYLERQAELEQRMPQVRQEVNQRRPARQSGCKYV